MAVEAARCAGALLAERVRRGAEREVSSKSTPTDLVSEADLASERAIRELLAARRPQDGFVGEEGDHVEGTSGLQLGGGPARRHRQLPVRAPAVVRERGGARRAGDDPRGRDLRPQPRAAVQRAPGRARARRARAETDGGCPSSAARGDRAGTRRAAPRASDLASAMVATGFAYDARVRAAQAQVLARVIPRVRDIRRFGSAALDLAWTAAGRYDAYFERTVKPWDIAAGTLLCEAVGLRWSSCPSTRTSPGGSSSRRRRCASRCWSWWGRALPRCAGWPLRRAP